MLVRIKDLPGGAHPLIDCDVFDPIKLPDGGYQITFFKNQKVVFDALIPEKHPLKIYIMEGGKTSEVIEIPPKPETCKPK